MSKNYLKEHSEMDSHYSYEEDVQIEKDEDVVNSFIFPAKSKDHGNVMAIITSKKDKNGKVIFDAKIWACHSIFVKQFFQEENTGEYWLSASYLPKGKSDRSERKTINASMREWNEINSNSGPWVEMKKDVVISRETTILLRDYINACLEQSIATGIIDKVVKL